MSSGGSAKRMDSRPGATDEAGRSPKSVAFVAGQVVTRSRRLAVGLRTTDILYLAVKRLLVALLAFCSPPALAADWPQWRGLARDGISSETNLLEQWPEGGPPLLWKTDGLGEGYSSVAVSDGRVFTQGQKERRQFVIALDEETGAKLWEAPHGDSYGHGRGGGPRGTPTVNEGNVYALGGEGSLISVEAATGKRLWNTNLLKRFGGRNISWGISESPLVDGNRVIVNAGANGASVVALDKKNGNLIWKSQSDEAGYSSAIRVEAGGISHYVVLTGEGAVGLRADNGSLLWRYERVSNRTANVATPIVRGDHVFVSSDYGTGGALLELTTDRGDMEAREIYFNRNMRNHYSTSVLIGDYLYGYSSRILTCMSFKTGEVAWRDRSVGKGQIIYADGHLYLLSEDGDVGLVEATPSAYQEKSRFGIGRGDYPTWALPAIANGKLFLRDQDALYCYNIRAD